MDHKTGGEAAIELGGRPLAVILRDRRRPLVDRVLGHLVDHVDGYGSLPPEALGGDITAAVERGLRVYLDVLASGDAPSAADLLDIGESAARRAEERIPLDAVIGAYLDAVRVSLDELLREVEPGDERALTAAFDRALVFLQACTSTVVTSYLDEHQLMSDVRADADGQLLDALLRGVTPDPATTPGLAGAYAVIRLAVDDHPDEHRPGVDASIAGHRKARRVRAELHRRVTGRAISSLTPTGGTILVPDDDGAPDGEDLPDLVARLADAAGADVWAALDGAPATGVAEAAKRAEAILDLVRRLGRPPGSYRLADVALESQLTTPGPARTVLAARAAPLADHPVLTDTLRRYLDTGRNRRRTALDLSVHPNTVDYRLRRSAALTGLDPTDPDDALQLTAALLAADAEAADRR